ARQAWPSTPRCARRRPTAPGTARGGAIRSRTREGLETSGAGAELEVAPSRPDGTPGPSTTIWVVRIGDELYVRSYRGRNGRWFRHAIQQRQGRIRSGGIERDVTFEEPVDADRQAIDAAYRSK